MDQLLEKTLKSKQEGNFDEGDQQCLQTVANYLDTAEMLLHDAIFSFEKGDYEKALDLFVTCYSHPDQNEATKEDVLNQIFIAYYQPNMETFKINYEKNIQGFISYEHNYMKPFIDFEDLPFLCIPRSDSSYYIFEKNSKKFKDIIILTEPIISYPNVSVENCVVGINLFNPLQLQSLAEQTRDPEWINNMKLPIYLIYADHTKMYQYLQLVDFASTLDIKRFVFFTDCDEQSEFRTFLEDQQACLPNVIVGDTEYYQQINQIVQKAETVRVQDVISKQAIINQSVSKYDKQYYKELFSGSYENIRILFYTSRFTQVVQYATRDFMQACKNLGIQCEMVIEKTDIHRVTQMELIDRIAEFNPNVIFRVNFFKSDFVIIPSNIMFITWMQDPAYQITSSEHAQKFNWNDFALTYTHKWTEQMSEIGYDRSRIAEQIVPIDEKKFYIRDMSQEEITLYTSDIAFPGNYQRPEKDLAELITAYTTDIVNSEVKDRMVNLLLSAYEKFRLRIENNELIYKREQCEEVINELATSLKIEIESHIIKQIANEFFHPVIYNLYRKITLKWLIDYGFKVKLWGRGWDTDPEFKPYSMGLLAHGDELAKMYSCSKIVPGAFFEYTAHFRSWESAACGALGIVRYIPAEFDLVNIREHFTADEHFIFYHDKEDLINKVKYYLANEDERKRIADNARQKVLQSMTYSGAVNKCLKLIKDNVLT